MSGVDSQDEKFDRLHQAARCILDLYGHAAPDTIRTVYADGDLNIGAEEETVEVIYRGTLVFRYAPEGAGAGRVFQDDGEWIEIVQRIAQEATAREAEITEGGEGNESQEAGS